MQWIRRQQRTLARVVLAVFVLGWLQAAAVPCVMAHGSAAPSGGPAQAHHHCQYCPPETQGSGGPQDDPGRCLYPHAAQVDSRASGALFFVLPSAPTVIRLEPAVVSPAERCISRAEPVPRPPLADSLCRRIE
jgi:hypothetical protein